MGTTVFSGVILEELLKNNRYEVVMVVTQPDRPFGRKRELKPPYVKEMALKHQLSVFQPEKLNDHAEKIAAVKPDVIVTCAYGQIVSQEILDIPTYQSINVHASLLPKYRGGAPIHWAIINGEKESGVTLMEMDAGMDSGAMISKEKVVIDPEDTMGDLEAKLMDASRYLSKEIWVVILMVKLKQRNKMKMRLLSLLSFVENMKRLILIRDVEDVYNHIRGLIPWPVSHGILDDQRVKFHGVKMKRSAVKEEPGTILKVHEEGVDIACKEGYVTITGFNLPANR